MVMNIHSQTGYVIFFFRCPLMWKNQLQTRTALSMFHAAYATLSFEMCQLVIILHVLVELVGCLNSNTTTPTIHAEVFEDSNFTYLIASNQPFFYCLHHLNVQWHFFWEMVCNREMKCPKLIQQINKVTT